MRKSMFADYIVVPREEPPDLSSLPIARAHPRFLYPELQCTGFCEYRMSSLRQWLHPKQKAIEMIKCKEVYDFMLEKTGPHSNRLDTCLNFQDGLAILRLIDEIENNGERPGEGVKFFEEMFGRSNGAFLLKSAVEVEIKEKGVLQHPFYAPFLCVFGSRVQIHWRWFEDGMIWSDKILRFQDFTEKVNIKPQRKFEIIRSPQAA